MFRIELGGGMKVKIRKSICTCDEFNIDYIYSNGIAKIKTKIKQAKR